MSARGLETTTAQGNALGVSHTTVLRVRSGEVSPSNSVIGRALLLLGVRFEELFEVIQTDPAERSVA